MPGPSRATAMDKPPGLHQQKKKKKKKNIYSEFQFQNILRNLKNFKDILAKSKTTGSQISCATPRATRYPGETCGHPNSDAGRAPTLTQCRINWRITRITENTVMASARAAAYPALRLRRLEISRRSSARAATLTSTFSESPLCCSS